MEELTEAVVLCPSQEGAPAKKGWRARYGAEHPRQRRLWRREQMRERLAQQDWQRPYRKRSISEANFALTKRGMGFRHFQVRGHEKVKVEWT